MKRTVMLALMILAAVPRVGSAQELARPSPPALEDFETDADADGVPEGWYNLRDAKLAPGGTVGPTCMRFDNEKPGRQARASRAFGIDGRKTEAIVVGLWVKVTKVNPGERLGEEASLQIDFYREGLITCSRGVITPWTNALGSGWVRIAKRIPVPPSTRDAIMTVGLLGAIGTLEIDGLTIEQIPVGGVPTTNLVLNGDFERGSPDPTSWSLSEDAKRVFPGYRSASCVYLTGSRVAASTDFAVRGDRLSEIEVTMMAQGTALRASGGGRAVLFGYDDLGQPVPGFGDGVPVFRWTGSFEWKQERAIVRVPSGAARVQLQIETMGSGGSLRFDDVVVTALPDPDALKWTPDHIETDTHGWHALEPSKGVAAKSALDASSLVPAPAGKQGAIVVRDHHLAFEQGGRARLFGVVLLPPLAFSEASVADALADRLSRSGVNLVRFSALDSPLGPGRSLYDDGLDDTLAFDSEALARFDHLIFALKSRGIYVAIELLSNRRFREGDKVPGWLGLSPGGGAAAAFDPVIRDHVLRSADLLLSHVNPETKLALKDDRVLAWVTIAGERTLQDRDDLAYPMPEESSAILRRLETPAGGARRTSSIIEGDQWKAIAAGLRAKGLKRPIAGASHWRREPEFNASQSRQGLDLIDDRLYWAPRVTVAPEVRSMVWRQNSELALDVMRKRAKDRPYVVGEWCDRTDGAWAFPYEAADLMFVTRMATIDDWDGFCRRGVFLHPAEWGASAPGTTGEQDVFAIAEALNANPQAFALLPHASSLYLREGTETSRGKKAKEMSWDANRGRLVFDTPHTQGVAGWPGRKPQTFAALRIEIDSPYAVVMVSAFGTEPIASSRKLLVTAVARAEPSDLRYADIWKGQVASPGHAPILMEPVRFRVIWKKRGPIQAFALNSDGSRKGPATIKSVADGAMLEIEGTSSTMHWELVQ